MHRNPERPLSPHLTIWKWGPHMLVSILHRVTGSRPRHGRRRSPRLVADGGGERARGLCDLHRLGDLKWLGIVIWVGLTWAFFQHTLSGLRHFVMDIGAGYRAYAQQILGDDDAGRCGRADRRGLGLIYLWRLARMTTETPPRRVSAASARHAKAAIIGGIERLTSVSTLLLFVWFLVSLCAAARARLSARVTEWLQRPLAAVPMLLLIVSTFWHLKLGLQVVSRIMCTRKAAILLDPAAQLRRVRRRRPSRSSRS